jgi:hypothetical protein
VALRRFIGGAEKELSFGCNEAGENSYSIFTSGVYEAIGPDAAFPQEKPHFA